MIKLEFVTVKKVEIEELKSEFEKYYADIGRKERTMDVYDPEGGGPSEYIETDYFVYKKDMENPKEFDHLQEEWEYDMIKDHAEWKMNLQVYFEGSAISRLQL